MAYPKKRRGFRPIHVDGRDYLWVFAAGPMDSVLVAQPAARPGQRLAIVLRGWRDPWLALSGFTVVAEPVTMSFLLPAAAPVASGIANSVANIA